MKIIILLIAGIFVFAVSNGQTNFKWEKSDSISKTQSQLFLETKIFLEKTLNSKNIIQQEDKESGLILVKGIIIKQPNNSNVYTYGYNISFKFSQLKYRIILDSVYCFSAVYYNKSIKKIEPFDGENCPKTGVLNGGISKKSAINMMNSLKSNFQSFVDEYEKQISSKTNLILDDKEPNKILTTQNNGLKQFSISDSIRLLEKKFLDFQQNYQSDKKEINLSGLYLKKAANNSYKGMALLLVSAGCSVLGANYQSKALSSKAASKASNLNSANASFIASGIIAIASLVCYISVPINIHKAGNKLHFIK